MIKYCPRLAGSDEPVGPDSVVSLIVDDVGQVGIQTRRRLVLLEPVYGGQLIEWLVKSKALDAGFAACVVHEPKSHLIFEVGSVQ